LPSLIYFSWVINRDLPLQKNKSNINVDINWLKCLGGFLHLKPTVGCQISTLIFEKKIMEGDLYKYPMKNILRTAKFFDIWHPAAGLRCRNPSRHFSQLKARVIPLT
jgi:hypothetical protein